MSVFGDVCAPAPALVDRVARRLGGEPRAETFAVAGDVLAATLLASGEEGLDRSSDALADAMVAALVGVQAETLEDAEAGLRLRLAAAAVVASVVRPERSAALDAAVSTWLGWGLGPPSWTPGAWQLALRTLLALHLDDRDAAVEAVHSLVRSTERGLPLLLHDWVVARVEAGQPERERQCLWQLVLSRRCGDGPCPVLVVVGAAALAERLDLPRAGLLAWFARVEPAPLRALA